MCVSVRVPVTVCLGLHAYQPESFWAYESVRVHVRVGVHGHTHALEGVVIS